MRRAIAHGLAPRCAGGLLLCVLCGVAGAAYPERPLRWVVPYAAGGSSDTVARIVGQKLSERLGQQVVVDNRTGAGTLIGTEIVAHSAADGYTLLVATPPLAVNPALYKKVSYDLERDFAAVTNVAGSSNLLVVHPSVNATTVKELIALAKANPNKYNYGSSGVGGASHLAMALFASMAGIEVTHVPYKGGAPAVADLIAGRLSLAMANLTTAQPHIRGGRLRGLGVGRSTRSPLFPEMPTINEAGVPGYEANNWNGIVVPAKTPRAVIERLQRDVVAVLKESTVAERMAGAGLEPIGDTPSQFERYLKDEAAKWSKLIKTAGIKAE
jgi:tripartite-type tricarboxylate transporter receptor subunit TctC